MTNTDKFKGKYRKPSTRWVAWDYGSNAAYFVTICTADRECDFGTITNGKIFLTPLGRSALDCWNEIPTHFPFVDLGEFVVMPNHVHGIVIINKPGDGGTGRDAKFCVSTNTTTTTPTTSTTPTPTIHPQQHPNEPQNKFGPQSKNLVSIIRGYKIGVTKYARQNNIPFEWQARYHDHVIRNLDEFNRISQYIFNNVRNWEKDAFNNHLSYQSPHEEGIP
jgi:putative transposase